MRVGYKRVSSHEQNPERQLNGMELERIFIEFASGKDTKRPVLQDMLNFLREGDSLYVHSLDRFARNLDDLRRMVMELVAKQVTVHFITESLTFNGEKNMMSNLLLSMMGAFAEFEREIILERQREGILKARQKGVYKGKSKYLTPADIALLKKMKHEKMKIEEISNHFQIGRTTVYEYLKCPVDTVQQLI